MKFNELPEEDRFNLQVMLGHDFDYVDRLVHFLLYDKCFVYDENMYPTKRYHVTVDIEMEDLTQPL